MVIINNGELITAAVFCKI